MFRIKAIYRGRGIRTAGSGVYQLKQREQWLQRLTEPGVRQRVEWLYEELDHLRGLRKRAKQAMLTESRKHRGLYVAENHSLTRTDSMCTHCGDLGYAASISYEASVMGLQWTGSGDAHERGI